MTEFNDAESRQNFGVEIKSRDTVQRSVEIQRLSFDDYQN